MRTITVRSTNAKVAAAVLAVGCLVTYPAVSSAQASAPAARQGDPDPSRLHVNVRANVNDAGTRVRMRARVTCPEGRKFRIKAELHQINTEAPYDDGGDTGVVAKRKGPELTGTCTGERQRLTWRMPVQPGTMPDGSKLFFPMTPSEHTISQVILIGRNFFSLYCAGDACAEDTGPRIVIV